MSKRLLLFAAAVVAVLGISFDQTAAFQNNLQNSQPKIGDQKVAVVDSSAFAEGITEYKKAIEKIEAEFKSRLNDMQTLDGNIAKAEDALKLKVVSMNAKAYKQEAELIQLMKRDLARKREDYEYDLQKSSERTLDPARDKIIESLKSYAKMRGFLIVYDLPASMQGGIVYFDQSINITEEFISEYNRKNPIAKPQ